MYCQNCGANNPEDSKFCGSCGSKLEITTVKEPKEEPAAKSSTNTGEKLWDKFAEIYDSRDKERDDYLNLSSDEFWTCVDKIDKIMFENFLADNKEVLNVQPYALIETIKSAYMQSMLTGYWFWLAGELLKGRKLSKPKVEYDKFVKNATKLIVDDYKKSLELIPSEAEHGMNLMVEHRMQKIFEAIPSSKSLSHSFIENLKGAIAFQHIVGYFTAIAEGKFRK